jgi:enoyl-CoA hydratase/carnithine racemase
MNDQVVLRALADGVLTLTFNRPDRLNAWNQELEDRYFDLLLEADDDPAVRAIVVTGAGRAFCAGADMDDLRSAPDADGSTFADRRPRHLPLTIRKPMIAAVRGAAVGLGLVEALYCDIRFASPDALFMTAFARRGLIAEYGSAWLLPRLVGAGNAADLLLSSRKVMGAEAQAMGLVNRVSAPDGLLDEATAYARMLARESSPYSMAHIKRQLAEAPDGTLAEAIAESTELMMQSFHGPDLAEGVAAFAERRAPGFAPLPPREPDFALTEGRPL